MTPLNDLVNTLVAVRAELAERAVAPADGPEDEHQEGIFLLDWEAHRAFMNALEAEGVVRLGGPLEEREDVLLVFRANDKGEIERHLADDPWTRSGILSTTRISRWELRIGEVT